MSGFAVTPGVFGKLPARADFVARNLPASFTDPWHAWLVRGLASAKRELAVRFEHAYMAAPVWRFVVPTGACGPVPAAGVMLPSVDAVGRLFPLTLAAVAPSLGCPLALVAALPWFELLEEVGRDALTCVSGAEAWFARLVDVVPPSLPVIEPSGCVHVPLSGGAVELAMLPALAGIGAEHAALFWCDGSPFVRACALVTPELPDGASFARLLSDPVPAVEDAS